MMLYLCIRDHRPSGVRAGRTYQGTGETYNCCPGKRKQRLLQIQGARGPSRCRLCKTAVPKGGWSLESYFVPLLPPKRQQRKEKRREPVPG